MDEAAIRERLRLLDEWESEAEVRDRFQLMAYGLRRKAAWQRKRYILDTVLELKGRLRMVLHRFLERREEK